MDVYILVHKKNSVVLMFKNTCNWCKSSVSLNSK